MTSSMSFRLDRPNIPKKEHIYMYLLSKLAHPLMHLIQIQLVAISIYSPSCSFSLPFSTDVVEASQSSSLKNNFSTEYWMRVVPNSRERENRQAIGWLAHFYELFIVIKNGLWGESMPFRLNYLRQITQAGSIQALLIKKPASFIQFPNLILYPPTKLFFIIGQEAPGSSGKENLRPAVNTATTSNPRTFAYSRLRVTRIHFIVDLHINIQFEIYFFGIFGWRTSNPSISASKGIH